MPKTIKMDINELAAICGHSVDSETNNGYGCDHSESDSGECHRTGCPLASYDSKNDLMIPFAQELLLQFQSSEEQEPTK